ncbi:MAG: LysR family transcriptional regulator substrate-binding protein [Oscillospiraceae bacterium]
MCHYAQRPPVRPYEAISPTLLNGCNFIMPVPGYDDVVNTVLQKSPFFPKIKYYTASDVAAISMVANDLGISVISSLQVGLLPDDVISRPFQGAYGRSLGIAIKSLRHAPPVIKEFVPDLQGDCGSATASPPAGTAA